MDAIRLRFRMNEQYNPIGRLKGLIEQFSARPHHDDAVTQLGSFYLFVVRDLERALKVYNIIIESDPENRAMLVNQTNIYSRYNFHVFAGAINISLKSYTMTSNNVLNNLSVSLNLNPNLNVI